MEPFELIDQLTARIDLRSAARARAYLRLARRHAEEFRLLVDEEQAAEDRAGR